MTVPAKIKQEFQRILFAFLFQTIVALVDTIISSRPWKIGHFYFLMLYSFIYILFQVLYLVCFQGTDEVSKLLLSNMAIIGRSYLMYLKSLIISILIIILQSGKNYVYIILNWNGDFGLGMIHIN